MIIGKVAVYFYPLSGNACYSVILPTSYYSKIFDMATRYGGKSELLYLHYSTISKDAILTVASARN